MKIAVIEDHALMRELLVDACRKMPGSPFVDGARDAESGLELCREQQPDIIILDLALPDRNGLDLLEDLLETCPRGRVIGMSGYTDEFTLHRAMRSKLHGFVDKNEQTIDALGEAIASVMNGQRYLSALMQQAHLSLRNDPVAFDKILSEREQDLLGLFGRGLSNAEVAADVGLSELTVRNYRCRLMAKLDLRTSPELMRYAMEKGFIHPASAPLRTRAKV